MNDDYTNTNEQNSSGNSGFNPYGSNSSASEPGTANGAEQQSARPVYQRDDDAFRPDSQQFNFAGEPSSETRESVESNEPAPSQDFSGVYSAQSEQPRYGNFTQDINSDASSNLGDSGSYNEPASNPYSAPRYGAGAQSNGSGFNAPPQGNFYSSASQQPYSNSYYGPYSENGYQPYTPGSVPPQPPVPEKKKKKKGFKIFLACVALLLVFALGAGTATVFKYGDRKGNSLFSQDDEEESTTHVGGDVNVAIQDTPQSSTDSKAAGSVLTASEVAAKCRPSNVGVLVYSNSKSSNSKAGEGSGIVMAVDETKTYTYIITCAHVIDESNISVKIQAEDGTSYDAEIAGYDTKTDLGVLRVKTTKLTVADFGNSDKLGIGDIVYAIGNPGGTDFFGSFTSGCISAINRPVNSEIGYTMKCIQHDAAINPGNSGGMLVNQYGQVVGINSQKIASSSYEGMGFAIPITSAIDIVKDLIDYGYVPNRPMLGITYYSVASSTQYSMIAQIKGLPAGTLIINSISPNSSLASTNVRRYDMITAVNGKKLDKADVLLELIDNGKVGDKLKLSICRVNSNYSIEEFDVTATLVEDKGQANPVETTTQSYIDPFSSDFWSQFGY
ncbi:MAG: trypsin-like peptidase domain-containing protein [Clostridiales bacterium]|nr:trypsin-like peptidase domain-containing protein [Clostridiales bacterium]